jgi:hypothetical protein
MSVLAYLQPRRESLKMPDAEKKPNKCGITWHGPVLSGKHSPQEELAKQQIHKRTRGFELTADR